MAWKTSFALGISGSELSLVGKVLNIVIEEKNIAVDSRNVAGDKRRSILKMLVPTISLDLAALTDAMVARLRGLRASQAVLNFICDGGMNVTDLVLTSTSTIAVTLPNTSCSGITIAGVYLATDTGRSGTNYYTTGSFNSATGIITLGSALPGANTQVVVDWTFTGRSVLMNTFTPIPHQGQFSNLWSAKVELEGA